MAERPPSARQFHWRLQADAVRPVLPTVKASIGSATKSQQQAARERLLSKLAPDERPRVWSPHQQKVSCRPELGQNPVTGRGSKNHDPERMARNLLGP
jgi:hypothetical protein